jgi:hypothetical protein
VIEAKVPHRVVEANGVTSSESTTKQVTSLDDDIVCSESILPRIKTRTETIIWKGED